MTKKDAFFTFGLTIMMGVLWALGEVVMGLWYPVNAKGHIFWFALIVVATLVVSVWHSLLNDESARRSPQEEKYERKMKKKQQSSKEEE